MLADWVLAAAPGLDVDGEEGGGHGIRSFPLRMTEVCAIVIIQDRRLFF